MAAACGDLIWINWHGLSCFNSADGRYRLANTHTHTHTHVNKCDAVSEGRLNFKSHFIGLEWFPEQTNQKSFTYWAKRAINKWCVSLATVPNRSMTVFGLYSKDTVLHTHTHTHTHGITDNTTKCKLSLWMKICMRQSWRLYTQSSYWHQLTLIQYDAAGTHSMYLYVSEWCFFFFQKA